jgi:glycerate 2-kinase
MRYLVAFDKFKDAISAEEACDLAASVLAPHGPVDCCPLTDGGDGFARGLTRVMHGTSHQSSVTGPIGQVVTATWGLVEQTRLPPAAARLLDLDPVRRPGPIALMDVASTSGLAQVPPARRDPWRTTTVGLGELILAATVHDPAAIVIGLGGSATNDLGLGALARLGLRCLTKHNQLIDPPYPAEWPRVKRLEGNLATNLPPLHLACDVSNPLFGAQGATAVFGPQKGLPHAKIANLEDAMVEMAARLSRHFEVSGDWTTAPGSGAAGGISAGLLASGRARLQSGFALVAACLDLRRRVEACDCVITGEGRFDATSLEGKGPGGLLRLAREMGKAAIVIAGCAEETARPNGVSLITLSGPAEPLPRALRETRPRLRAVLQRIAAKTPAGPNAVDHDCP